MHYVSESPHKDKYKRGCGVRLVSMCVCVFFNLRHVEFQNIHSTSKVRTFSECEDTRLRVDMMPMKVLTKKEVLSLSLPLWLCVHVCAFST